MKTFIQTNINDLLGKAGEPQFLRESNSVQFAESPAFHIYADLDLNLSVAAAENPSDAMQCVDLIDDFAAIADRVCGLTGTGILEVQGTRIHFLLPGKSQQPSSEDITKVVAFSAALVRMAYAQLRPRAGRHWKGFSIAADFGPTILVSSSFGGGSLVSLGGAANRPAKRLGQGVDSGHLALPHGIGQSIPGARPSGDWVLVHVNQPSQDLEMLFDSGLNSGVRSIAEEVLRNPQRSARAFVSEYLPESLSGKPLRDRGVCLRADLDGFSKAVDKAFAAGAAGVAELVKHFAEVMEYPKEFIRLQPMGRKIVELPWAGDCCTLFIRPGLGETVESLRRVLPVQGGLIWHEISEKEADKVRWSSALGEARWATGFACGDTEEGGDGWAVVAEIATSKRKFRVIVGWCARRAQDAQECPGVGPQSIALHQADYRHLESLHRPHFSQIPNHPTYYLTNYGKLKASSNSTVETLAKAEPVRREGCATPVPAPRPYSP